MIAVGRLTQAVIRLCIEKQRLVIIIYSSVASDAVFCIYTTVHNDDANVYVVQVKHPVIGQRNYLEEHHIVISGGSSRVCRCVSLIDLVDLRVVFLWTVTIPSLVADVCRTAVVK